MGGSALGAVLTVKICQKSFVGWGSLRRSPRLRGWIKGEGEGRTAGKEGKETRGMEKRTGYG